MNEQQDFYDNQPLKEQVEILADWILTNKPEWIVSGGAIETALTQLQRLTTNQ